MPWISLLDMAAIASDGARFTRFSRDASSPYCLAILPISAPEVELTNSPSLMSYRSSGAPTPASLRTTTFSSP